MSQETPQHQLSDVHFSTFNGSGYAYFMGEYIGSSHGMPMVAFRVKPIKNLDDGKMYVQIPQVKQHHCNMTELNKTQHPLLKRMTIFNVFNPNGARMMTNQVACVMREKLVQGKYYAKDELEATEGVTVDDTGFIWTIGVNF